MIANNQDLAVFDPLKAAVTVFVAPTSQIVITDSASNTAASVTLKKLKEMQKTLETRRKEHTQPLVDRQRAIIAYCDEIAEPLLNAEASIKEKQKVWAIAEQRRLDEERRKIEAARAEEERKAAAERARIEAEAKTKRDAEERARRDEADRQRKELERQQAEELEALRACGIDPQAESKAAAEAAQKLAAEQEAARIAADKRAEEDRIAEQARLDREAKEREAAAALRAKEIEASRPKNMRKVRKFRVIGPLPAEYTLPNEPMIRRAMMAGIRVAGVEYYEETEIVAR